MNTEPKTAEQWLVEWHAISLRDKDPRDFIQRIMDASYNQAIEDAAGIVKAQCLDIDFRPFTADVQIAHRNILNLRKVNKE